MKEMFERDYESLRVQKQINEHASQLNALSYQVGGYNAVTDLDINNAYCANAESPLSIPTYVAANDEVVHPSLVLFPYQWNGYYYWMAFTPYTAANNAYENPSIVASNDLVTWVVPSGLTNPIAPNTGSPEFNNDPNLCIDPDGKTLHMIWNWVNPATIGKVILSSSTDGIQWSTPVELLSLERSSFIVGSPRLMYDGNEWVMWMVNGAESPIRLYKRTAADVTGPWSEPGLCAISTIASGCEIWHFDITRVGTTYVMIMMDGLIGQYGVGARLWLAKSIDGLTWTAGLTPVLIGNTNQWDYTLYKATIVPRISSDGTFGLKMIYGTNNAHDKLYLFGLTDITFDKDKRQSDYFNNLAQANNRVGKALFCDTFNRANGDVVVASDGQSWSNAVGSGMAVVSGKATIKSDSTRVVRNVGVSDYEISMEVWETTQTHLILFRSTSNTSSYFRFGSAASNAGVYDLEKYDGSTTTYMPQIQHAVAGDILRVRCIGSLIKCYINDKLVATMTDAMNLTETYVGIVVANALARVDNFLVRAV